MDMHITISRKELTSFLVKALWNPVATSLLFSKKQRVCQQVNSNDHNFQSFLEEKNVKGVYIYGTKYSPWNREFLEFKKISVACHFLIRLIKQRLRAQKTERSQVEQACVSTS